MEKIVIGIDLGTTCSSVSFLQGGEVKILENKSGNYRIPSIVHFSLKNNELKADVGENAEDFLSKDSKNTIFDSKRMIGRQFDDPEIQKLIPSWPFRIEKKEDDDTILICLDELNIKLEPYKVSGYILKYLHDIGNEYLKPEQRTNQVIITVPANFCTEQRLETKKAAEFFGLEVIQLLNEPTAAGIDYGITEKPEELRYIIVFDFGGGTLDVSLLSIQNSDIKIILTDGDLFLGGRNFDENVMNYLIEEYKFQNLFKNEKYRAKRMKILKEKSIKIKEKLSEQDSFETTIEFNEDNEFDIEMTIEKFESINKNLIERICIPVERLIKASKIDKNKINDILLVGGSSNMKFVKRKLQEYFGKEPFMHSNSGAAVARGAAYSSSQKFNELSQLSCIDVASYSIGIQLHDGKIARLINKGDVLPATGQDVYKTIYYRQESIKINIYECPSENPNEDYLLGTFSVVNIPKSNHFVDFNIMLYLDKDGILSASACLVNSDIRSETTIDIKRVKNQIINHVISSDEMVLLEKKIFLQNMRLFIRFNYRSISTCLTPKRTTALVRNLKFFETNYSDIELLDILNYFNENLGIYFIRYPSGRPDFL